MEPEVKSEDTALVEEGPLEEKWDQGEEKQKFLDMGEKGKKYLDKGYNAIQLREIRQGMDVNVDVESWLQMGYDWLQIDEIIKGIGEGLDVKNFANVKFQSLQMEQIRLGLENKLDVSLYAKENYDHKVMREIRLAMMMQFNIMADVEKGYSGEILREIRLAKLDGVNISSYIQQGYDEDQLDEIRQALKNKVDLDPYLNQDLFGMQLNQIRLGLESNLDVSSYGTSSYNWMQMREIRLGLEENLDIGYYKGQEFNWEQMQQIRMGLEQYLKVDSFAKIQFSAKEMEAKRLHIMQQDQASRILQQSTDEQEIQELIANLQAGGVPLDVGCGVITIADDEMSANISLREPADGEKEYTENEIVRLLNKNDITHGIDFDMIRQMLRERQFRKTCCVARGKLPENGLDGYFEYFFQVEAEKGPKVLPNGTIDYYDLGNIENVEAGQKLAQYHKATMGVYGYTVKGKLLTPERRGKEQLPLKGIGVDLSEDRMTYTSKLTGQVALKNNNLLEVCSVLTINGNVDLTCGNIFFAGDVVIRGDILTGFRVIAGRNLQVDGHIESAYVKVGQDMVVRGGMNGNGIGRIEAGGNVSGNFFDNTILNLKGDLKANYLNNCQVRSEGKVMISGAKGVILGGFTRATKGISSFYVGNAMEIPTHIGFGPGPEIMAQYVEVRKKQDKLTEEIAVLQRGLNEYRSRSLADDPNNRKMYQKLVQAAASKKKEMELIQQQKDQLETVIEEGKGAKFAINGYLYPGTRIVAGIHSLHVTETQCSVILSDGDDQILVSRGR